MNDHFETKRSKSNNFNLKLSELYFFASCPSGLEELLLKELCDISDASAEQLSARLEKGGISFCCSMKNALRVMLRTRVASKIYWNILNFTIQKEKDLYDEMLKSHWTEFFSLNKTFKIQTILGRTEMYQSRFKNSLHLSQVAKDAIADSFRELRKGKRPDVDTKHPDIPFLLYVSPESSREERVSVSVDLSGEPLGNRFYRQQEFSAPLKENLAASILMLTEFDFANNEKSPFIDGMCGSGTFVIEALLLKGRIPPSYLRVQENIPFAIEKMNPFIKEDELKSWWKNELLLIANEAEEGLRYLKNTPITIFASDINPKAVATTKNNLRAAGLLSCAKVEVDDLCHRLPPDMKSTDGGLLICNPPYGERLMEGGDQELKDLYRDIGENFKTNFKGFRAYVFTGNIELRKSIQLQTSKRIKLYNGDIECRLFEYKLF